MSEFLDLKKLRVAELRDALKQRGLDTKGNKPQLVRRLEKVIRAESGEPVADGSQELDSSLEQGNETFEDSAFLDTSVMSDENVSMVNKPDELTESEQPEDSQASTNQILAQEVEESENPESDFVSQPNTVINSESQPNFETESKQDSETELVKQDSESESKQDAEIEDKSESETQPLNLPEPAAESGLLDVQQQSEAPECQQDESTPDQPEPVNEEQAFNSTSSGKMETTCEEPEVDQAMEESVQNEEPRGVKRSRSRSPVERQRTPEHISHQPIPEPDNEDWLEATNVVLDRFNADLNLRIDESGLKATPITAEGFAFMWAGARTNYGANKGKIAFEVKFIEEIDVHHLPSEETSRHVGRVGFSTDDSGMQLGEVEFSYGYGGTAKSSTKCQFNDYGATFGAGDVIGAYADLDADPILIQFTKNGEDQGNAFEVNREELNEKALFPHVLSKNINFELNFGEREETFFPIKEEFTLLNNIPVEDRIRGTLPPKEKSECEMLMMCGLPGCGKTTWANKHMTENPDRRYNVLGTNNILDKMRVMGLPRRRNYAGRWDVLIDKSTKCLNRLLDICVRKKRNYILDQTNVYPTAQRRKMRPFEGFQRKAIVIVPTNEEFESRVKGRTSEEGKDIPESAVLEMKANFKLPETGSLFDEVTFVELNQEEATELVAKYNKEARAALPADTKRYRYEYDRDRSHHSRGSGYREYNARPRYDSRDRRRDDRYDRYGSNQDRNRGYDRSRNRDDYRNSYRSSSDDRRSNRSYRDQKSGGGRYDSRGGGGGYGGGSGYNNSGNRRDSGHNRQNSWGGSGNRNYSNSPRGGYNSGSAGYGQNQQQGGWNQANQWSGYQQGQAWNQQWQGQQQQQTQGYGQQGYGYNWNQSSMGGTGTSGQQTGWYNYNQQQQQR